MDVDRVFEDYAKEYNRIAEAKGLPLFPFEPVRPIRLRDLLDFKNLNHYMSNEESERFRGDFFRILLSQRQSDGALCRSWQQSRFVQKGVTAKKLQGSRNATAVCDAAIDILAKRKKMPSDRELARLVAEKTGLSVNTVRGQIRKMASDK